MCVCVCCCLSLFWWANWDSSFKCLYNPSPPFPISSFNLFSTYVSMKATPVCSQPSAASLRCSWPRMSVRQRERMVCCSHSWLSLLSCLNSTRQRQSSEVRHRTGRGTFQKHIYNIKRQTRCGWNFKNCQKDKLFTDAIEMDLVQLRTMCQLILQFISAAVRKKGAEDF